MKASLIFTILGGDRPGLVETIADVISQHEGNWLESRMAKLSGHFAGILRVEVPEQHQAALTKQLATLSSEGLQISVASEEAQPEPTEAALALEIVGHDQPGIVKRLASAHAAHGANVIELETSLESAPMAGHLLFRTEGSVSLAETTNPTELITALENLGSDLSVTITT